MQRNRWSCSLSPSLSLSLSLSVAHLHPSTYDDVLDKSERVGAVLQAAAGDRSGDLQDKRVAFLCGPGETYVASQLASWRTGGVAVPLCTAHPPAELEYFLDDSGASVVLGSGKYKDIMEPLAAARGATFVDVDAVLGGDGTGSGGGSGSGSAGGGTFTPLAHLNASDLAERPAMLIYTSGTTGKPKGVVNRHSALEAQITNLVDAWRWQADDRILHLLPLHHVHGVVNKLLCALWAGACVDFMSPFDARAVWQKFARSDEDGLTLFMAVPTVYAKLIEAYRDPALGLSDAEKEAGAAGARKLRLMVSGSAALPVSVLQDWESITGHFLLERYGMTEFGMGVSNPYEPASGRREGRVGQPFPNVDVRIVDPAAAGAATDGAEVADGESGEIRIKGPIVFKEYWNRPDATAKEFDADGFFKTGDIGEKDPADGSIKIVGRASVDIIKSGGYKISALDVERELLEHRAIAEAYVVGAEDATWGQVVAAVIRMKPGEAPLTLDGLRTWGADRTAKYKLPSKLEVVDDIPKNPTGKVNKKDLLKAYF